MAIQVIKAFFCTVLLCIFSISSWSRLLLLGFNHFRFFIVPSFGWNVPLLFPTFLKRSLVLPFLLFSSIYFLVSLQKAFCLCLLCSGTPHLVGCTIPVLLCFSLLAFPQLFGKPPQPTTLPSCISFSLEWFCSLSLYNIMDVCSQFFRQSVF